MKMRGGMYVQYGCGPCSPDGWMNFDASPTIFFERIPIIGKLYSKNSFRFGPAVRHGDIVKGLPIANNSVDGLYASHVLEHLSLEDCATALKNSYDLLRVGGRFRLIVPDLRARAQKYLDSDDSLSAGKFLQDTALGQMGRPKGLVQRLAHHFGNSTHRWMWDEPSMLAALHAAGFSQVRRCEFGDSGDPMFASVEQKDRFQTDEFKELALEAIK